MIVNRSTPLFRQGLTKAPAHPLGDRVFVRPLPVEQVTEGGIAIAETAQKRTFAGILVAAGDQAADKLYDLGVEIGDEVWYAKYAGVIEEWQHIIRDGEDKSCKHDGRWDFIPRDQAGWKLVKQPDIDMQLRSCAMCGALKLSERIIIMTSEDVMCDVDLEARLEAGIYQRERGETDDGKTRYYLVRFDGWRDTFETRKER